MALARVAGLAWVGAVALACSAPPTATAPPHTASGAPAPKAVGYASDEASWSTFRSKRFQLTVPLPDGRAWDVDDARPSELVAEHPPTRSRLSLRTTEEHALVHRHRCEERARALGLVPGGELTTVEDRVVVGPGALDSRLWVAIDAPTPGGEIEGHVFLFGASLRRCLFVHLRTTVASAKEQEVLASRLAVASERIVGGIALDPPRTSDETSVRRDRPDIRR